MAYKRNEVSDLGGLVKAGNKKFVRYKEGAQLYSMGIHSFECLAKEAGAIYRIKKIVLINTAIVDEYLENFHEEEE